MQGRDGLSKRGTELEKAINSLDSAAMLNDNFDAVSNPEGFVNIGTAENVRLQIDRISSPKGWQGCERLRRLDPGFGFENEHSDLDW